ncbi:MAG: hypothetical protein ACYCUF_06510, partial [Acidimicrobiales bacterium]|nr:hypothetical protein [Actinomycetota bacterium]MDA8185774.1 hypothetical protein [Actinomycetota bacterium]
MLFVVVSLVMVIAMIGLGAAGLFVPARRRAGVARRGPLGARPGARQGAFRADASEPRSSERDGGSSQHGGGSASVRVIGTSRRIEEEGEGEG